MLVWILVVLGTSLGVGVAVPLLGPGVLLLLVFLGIDLWLVKRGR